MSELKRTPLYPAYQANSKTIDFGGWELPVHFSSIQEEHHAVRQAAGLFDVSHMGEILVHGPASKDFLQYVLTNDLDMLVPNKAQYSVMCHEDGGTVDDLIVYMLEENRYLLVVNAANTEKDFKWLISHKRDGVEIENQSEAYMQVALQGPHAEQILQQVTAAKLSEISFFRFAYPAKLEDIEGDFLISRTGYTGEDGFEIYGPAASGQAVWELLLKTGQPYNLQPVGLGARDTLRFEANLPLYGNELTKEITPVEAGIGFAVKTNKSADFIGKEVLKKQKENGTERKLVGIEMLDKGIPRHGYPVFSEDEQIGEITTGTKSPTLDKSIGLALIQADAAEQGNVVEVQIRKKRLQAKVVAIPFYKRK
ncbi:aminomethyltransferase [Terribacillus halophilus]|uniref:Aminomethyltransferase n=1 Tax=Terribacillus halophilus TaxID=361279 RepID=A0A1G6VK46_9BACI|nr:glycine cleavage system aminomethyltransferase GcvT [Terribacillus halophilus]SDD53982.1 aminomethyltransferase [Terribacillus halophilus]